jgi:glycosyltransferase involved in cell wall biosynthesis
MLITVFTPTHNPQFIERLSESLKAQTCQDFEWLVVCNGDVKAEDLELDNPKVRVIDYTGQTQNIGEIKHFCCLNAQGDLLVEVDHDDELTPDCLQEVAEAFRNKYIDFVYSNCCEIAPDGSPWTYSQEFGWQYRPFEWKGNQLLETMSFEPSPASFSKIWYAPNHVRAWRANFYHSIGGHDRSLDVCDDQDLLARTYIHGNIKHIPKCLYVYYFHEGNTSKGEKNGLIQQRCLDIHDKYIYQLVEKWCDLNKLRKIDLCGGFNCPIGYESVDMENGTIQADLNGPWPFEDGSIGLIRAHDAIEHLKDPIHTMKEAWRCLAPNGWFLTFTPSTDGRGAFQDPTHVSFWNSNSFWYYTKAMQAQYIGTPVRFQLNHVKNFYPSDFHQFHNIVYVKADLLKFAGRTPGLIEI